MLVQYKLMSKIYDLLDVIYFRNKKRNPRQALLDLIPNEKVKVMELCVGTASNSILIAKNRSKAQIYGVDRSKEMLEIALRKIMKQKILNLQFRRRDAAHTGIKAGTFDYVVIALVLHESTQQEADELLREAARILKKGGRIFVLEWEEPEKWWQKLLFESIRRLEPKGFKEFVSMDFDQYFVQHDLKLLQTKHCDYSRVFQVSKMGDRKEN